MVRTGSQNGTPMPHEEPQNLNPPSGVLLNYWLKDPATKPLKLELLNSAGVVRACAASDTRVRPVDTEAINVQAIWEQPAPPPTATAGMQRFALNAPGGRAAASTQPDACTSSLPPAPTTNRGGATALPPGQYTVRLTLDGQTYTQPVTLKPDPRDAH
jgi:hypothetical protein